MEDTSNAIQSLNASSLSLSLNVALKVNISLMTCWGLPAIIENNYTKIILLLFLLNLSEISITTGIFMGKLGGVFKNKKISSKVCSSINMIRVQWVTNKRMVIHRNAATFGDSHESNNLLQCNVNNPYFAY